MVPTLKESSPNATLWAPLVRALHALVPIAIFLYPLVKAWSVSVPIPILLEPSYVKAAPLPTVKLPELSPRKTFPPTGIAVPPVGS